MKLTRRTFLKVSALAGLAAGVAGCSVDTETLVEAEKKKPVGQLAAGKWIPTGCLGCTSWCALEAYIVNGRAIKVRGNVRSKVNEGKACPRSHLAIQQLYDPDRIKQPMKRTNAKKGRGEDPKWVPITWDEALNTIADKIMDLRNNNETHKYCLLRGRYTYNNPIIYDAMPKIIGSNNNISHSAICAEADKFGPYYTQGYWNYRDYDMKKTKYVILWGMDPLAANRQVALSLGHWGDVLQRAKVVTIDPRFTSTAAKSHQWIPIEPGQDGALAVALAHVILTEGLWSKEFVGDFADGMNKFKYNQEVDEASFRETYSNGVVKWWNLELKDKTPEWAAAKTGIDAAIIRTLAKEFAAAAPSAILWMGRGAHMQVRGAYNSMAMYALNGLVGSVEQEGGVLEKASPPEVKISGWENFYDDIAKTALAKYKTKIDQRGTKEFPALNEGKSGGGVVTNRAADGILNKDPHEIKVIISYFSNFAFSCPGTDRWEQALAQVPFFVHCVTNVSETSHFADILLPATNGVFEQWAWSYMFANLHTHVRLIEPVVKRFWDVRNPETEVIWLLAKKLAERGFTKLEEFCDSIKDPETGKSAANYEEFGLFVNKYQTQKMWDPAKYVSGDKINGWPDFVEKGVWNSGQYPYKKQWGKFKTKTNKFEFYSETLKAALTAHADKHKTTVDDIMQTVKYLARGEQAFVPHYEEPVIIGDEKQYPLVLAEHKSRLNREGRSANCTWYQEFKDLDPGDAKWDDVVKINPRDAAQFGIKHGDKVRIVSPAASIAATASLFEGVRPGTLSKCYGQGHWAYGRVAKGVGGGNNNAILPAEYERLSGATAFYATTRVRIEKV